MTVQSPRMDIESCTIVEVRVLKLQHMSYRPSCMREPPKMATGSFLVLEGAQDGQHF